MAREALTLPYLQPDAPLPPGWEEDPPVVRHAADPETYAEAGYDDPMPLRAGRFTILPAAKRNGLSMAFDGRSAGILLVDPGKPGSCEVDLGRVDQRHLESALLSASTMVDVYGKLSRMYAPTDDRRESVRNGSSPRAGRPSYTVPRSNSAGIQEDETMKEAAAVTIKMPPNGQRPAPALPAQSGPQALSPALPPVQYYPLGSESQQQQPQQQQPQQQQPYPQQPYPQQPYPQQPYPQQQHPYGPPPGAMTVPYHDPNQAVLTEVLQSLRVLSGRIETLEGSAPSPSPVDLGRKESRRKVGKARRPALPPPEDEEEDFEEESPRRRRPIRTEEDEDDAPRQVHRRPQRRQPEARVEAEAPPPNPAKLALPSLNLNWLMRLPAKPTVSVIFDMPTGTQTAKYHDVVVTDQCVVLVYDTRYDAGGHYIPPDTGDGYFTVTVGKDSQVIEVTHLGIQYPLGALDHVVLIRKLGG